MRRDMLGRPRVLAEKALSSGYHPEVSHDAIGETGHHSAHGTGC
jgi:hypothetical protein